MLFRSSLPLPVEVAVLLRRPPSPVPAVQSLVLVLAPSGGQTTARRNAWASMSADAARARARREAAAALAVAEAAAVPSSVNPAASG